MTTTPRPTNFTDQRPPSQPLLANRYQVIRILGEGGFGTTYLATDTQMPSQRPCVVKQLKPLEDNSQIYQLVQDRFQREAAILETLGGGSPQIPNLYAYFSEDDRFYLVEEWIEGETLNERIKRTGCMNEAQVRSLLLELLPVIQYIHSHQMVHRDIKPDNILLRAQDGKPVLIDFGAVKETMGTFINSQGDSSRSIVVGTPGFMPPEQGAGRPVFSSDLYSLGLTAIFLLTGRIPQDLATDPRSGLLNWQDYAPNISADFAQVLNRVTRMEPATRFVTAVEMQQALTQSTPQTPKGWQSTVVSQPQAPVSRPPASIPPHQNPLAWNSTVITPEHYSGQPPSYPPPTYPAEVQPGAQPLYAAATPLQPSTPPPQSDRHDWIKAVIVGGLIGLSILGGTLIIRAQLLNKKESPPEAPPIPESIPKNSTPSVPPSAPPTPVPRASQPLPSTITPNATVSGDPGRKNIRSGPGTQYSVLGNVYPGDRIQVMGSSQESNGFTWYNVIAPTAGTEGWIAHHLVTLDSSPSPPPSPAPEPQSVTNATVVGGGIKNIRSGPGTVFGVIDQIATGERVRIIGRDYDRGGYLWYNVSAGSTQGWIAAQLIDPD